MSSNIHDVNHISNNFERFDVKKNNGNFSCNRSVYIPYEHQNLIENSNHRYIFADLQAGQKQGPSFQLRL